MSDLLKLTQDQISQLSIQRQNEDALADVKRPDKYYDWHMTRGQTGFRLPNNAARALSASIRLHWDEIHRDAVKLLEDMRTIR